MFSHKSSLGYICRFDRLLPVHGAAGHRPLLLASVLHERRVCASALASHCDIFSRKQLNTNDTERGEYESYDNTIIASLYGNVEFCFVL